MTDITDEWITSVFLLSDDEAVALWTAMHQGYLTWVNPTDRLVRTFTTTRLLEGRTAVVLMPGPHVSLLVASVPDLEWLPTLVLRLREAGAYIDRVMPEGGVVNAVVPKDRAHRIAKEVAVFAPGLSVEPESVSN